MKIRPRRSVLYMPGSNARALEKAKTLAADCLILDLEDAVAPDQKEEARAQVAKAVRDGGYGTREITVRVNGFDTSWYADAIYLCDPILGDDPSGLYIPEAVARAIGSVLVPRADFITPNRFELGWLAGQDVTGVTSALKAAHSLKCANIIATSVMDMSEVGECADLLITPNGAMMAKWQRRVDVPHGSGDALAALFLGNYVRQRRMEEAFGLAVAGTRLLIEAAGEESSLPLETCRDVWVKPDPAPLIEVGSA